MCQLLVVRTQMNTVILYFPGNLMHCDAAILYNHPYIPHSVTYAT